MKTYLVLAFIEPGKKPSGAGGMEDWQTWAQEYADQIADMGSPLTMGVEGSASGDFNKITEDMWPAHGYMMLKAENIDKAQELVATSPLSPDMHLRIFEKGEM